MIFAFGAIAQLVEHLHGMQGVSGSSPLSSILSKRYSLVELPVPAGLNLCFSCLLQYR